MTTQTTAGSGQALPGAARAWSRADELAVPSWQLTHRAVLVAVDVLLVSFSVLAGYFARFHGVEGEAGHTRLLAAVLAPGWLLSLALCGAYARRYLGSGTHEVGRVARACLIVAAAIGTFSYVVDARFARGFVLLTLPLATCLLIGGRMTGRFVLRSLRRHGRAVHRVVAVGAADEVLHLVINARREPWSGFQVAGVCVPPRPAYERRSGVERRSGDADVADQRSGSDRRGAMAELQKLGVPVLGEPRDAVSAVARANADTLTIAGSHAVHRSLLRRLAWELEGSPVRMLVSPALTDVAGPRVTVRPVAGQPLLQIEQPTFSGLQRVSKEAVDRLLAAFLLLCASPVLLAVALAIKLDSRGPVFYRQVRSTQGGREFRCWKFRSMRVGADKELPALAEHNESDGALFKMRADPRVTRVGRHLRRFSIDEVPQLLNVLSGSMSLVGPRPPLPSEVATYSRAAHRRLLVKPGLTGLWQVSGRSDLSWDETVRLDLYYVENWSPLLDLNILARTFTAVVRGRGAY